MAVVVAGHHAGRESLRVPGEVHGGQLVDLVMELDDLAAQPACERDGLAGAKALELLSLVAARDEVEEVALRQTLAAEDLVEGVAASHPHPLERGLPRGPLVERGPRRRRRGRRLRHEGGERGRQGAVRPRGPAPGRPVRWPAGRRPGLPRRFVRDRGLAQAREVGRRWPISRRS